MHKSFHLGKYEVQGRLGFESCYFHVLRDLRLLNLVAICKGWKPLSYCCSSTNGSIVQSKCFDYSFKAAFTGEKKH